MYYPIQIPSILNKEFSRIIKYSEDIVTELTNFVICIWEMQPQREQELAIENIIITDGCIDIVVDFDKQLIGYAGMSRTEFHHLIEMPGRFMGARLKPGAFHQLTGLAADTAMNDFLPLEAVDPDFDQKQFFAHSFEDAKKYFKAYLQAQIEGKEPDDFTTLFDCLESELPSTAVELCEQFHFSLRQCQRHFAKHFGITPQMVLCILRFQKCLTILTQGKATPGEVLAITTYYDQSHFIKDFKQNIGITPFELVRKYTG